MIRKIFLLFAVMMVNFSAFADWKEDIIDEMVQLLDAMSEKIKEIPTMEDSDNVAVNAHAFYSAMSALCIGFISETENPLPESTVMRSVRLNESFMRGETPSNRDISRLGLECLMYAENEMMALGMSKQDVEETMYPMMRLQLHALKGMLSK